MAKKVDLIGMRYGKLTVVERTDQREGGYCIWRCRCDCGGEILVSTKRLKNGTVTDCGCIPADSARRGRTAEDLTGRRFGKLTVIRRIENKYNRTCWLCQCDCGNETEATEDSLMYRNVRSCGCLKQEIQRQIPDRLHRFDGTCVEFLDKRKYRSDNTSGFRGVFRSKNGRFRVSIGFKNQRFYLGTYQNYEDAVDVRLKAEEQIHHAFVEAYHIWKEQCMSSQEEIPFIVHCVLLECQGAGSYVGTLFGDKLTPQYFQKLLCHGLCQDPEQNLQ